MQCRAILSGRPIQSPKNPSPCRRIPKAPNHGRRLGAECGRRKRSAIYIGVGNSYTGASQPTTDSITAIDLRTGRILWSRQQTAKDIFVGGCRPGTTNPNCPADVGPDFDFGATPVLTHLASGKDVIIAGQKSGIGYALDPDNRGAILWEYRAGDGGALGGI